MSRAGRGANPDLWIERTAQGEIVILPPAGYESGYQSGEAFGQLREWAKRDGRAWRTGDGARHWHELAALGTEIGSDLAFGSSADGYVAVREFGDGLL